MTLEEAIAIYTMFATSEHNLEEFYGQIADWLEELRDRREEERRLETVAIDRGYTP